ncbi:HNH endonuclease [Labrys sp. (in: a-proteobacteria)]|uniref:HNH endonuclease n=1 Tax=Labrys sp. (in: a-proteobacteria) TaxID=1917972 RepID=UPI0039E655CA
MAKLTAMKPSLRSPPPLLSTPPKIADRFYLTKEWRDLVASIKRERGPYCEAVLPGGQVCRSSHRIIGDHIHERRDGGADLDRNNVRLLCFACHQAKTAAARKARARGQV